jgi:hypothetical protein
MARPAHGRRPRPRSFDRRHAPADLPAYRLGKRARQQYDRLVHVAGPTGPALGLLSVLLDLARDPLNDVEATQAQLAELWLARSTLGDRLRARALGWGRGVASVRRATRDLEAAGWISLQDVPLPEAGGRHIIRYRLHIPDHPGVQAAWRAVLTNTGRKQAEAVSGPRTEAERAHGGRPVVPPAGTGEAVAELDEVEAPELTRAEAIALARRLNRPRLHGHDPP